MKRCSLCGGRLDLNKKCILCGLDNSKNDDNYKHLVNRNTCENQPLTHVHQEKKQYTYEVPQYAEQSKMPKIAPQVNTNHSGRQMGGIILGVTIAAVLLIVVMIRIALGVVDTAGDNYTYTEEMDYDVYDYVSYELPEDGETYTTLLGPGVYTVGVHIPEGTYTASVISGDYGMVEIRDHFNYIYSFANIGYEDEATSVEDLRLYRDAYFVVSTGIVIQISAENVRDSQLVYSGNYLMDTITVTDTMVAGEDFEAGVYDIVYQPTESDECGNVEYIVPADDGEYVLSVVFDAVVGSETYHNVVLPEGAVISLEDLRFVRLVPSQQIGYTSLEEYYEYY